MTPVSDFYHRVSSFVPASWPLSTSAWGGSSELRPLWRPTHAGLRHSRHDAGEPLLTPDPSSPSTPHVDRAKALRPGIATDRGGQPSSQRFRVLLFVVRLVGSRGNPFEDHLTVDNSSRCLGFQMHHFFDSHSCRNAGDGRLQKCNAIRFVTMKIGACSLDHVLPSRGASA